MSETATRSPAASRHRVELEEEGYTIFPGVLDADQVATIRAGLERHFTEPKQPGDTDLARSDLLSRIPESRFLLEHPPFVDALREVLGDDFRFLPEMTAHHQGFGNWHKDTTSMEQDGETFHRSPDFRMVQCAIYMQDQTERYAGGLDVVPGSHKGADPTAHGGLGSFLYRLRRRIGGKVRTLPSKAGDLVVFDLRTDHRATEPQIPPQDFPREAEKYAIFFVCSSNSPHVENYKRFISGRAGYDYLENHEYPGEVRELAAQNNLTLA